MYLEAPPKTWYDSKDGLKPAERRQTEDQRLEKTYKDNELKKVEDPLSTMQAYLKRREDVKAAQERHRANPWDDTPRTLTSDRTPIQPSRLGKLKGRNGKYRRSPSPEKEIEEGPARPPAAESPVAIEEAARQRETSERERARALLAARKRDTGSVTSTPRSEFGYQTGMYNRAETRDAKLHSSLRWDDDRRDGWKHRR